MVRLTSFPAVAGLLWRRGGWLPAPRRLASVLVLLFLAMLAAAAQDFPALTGRVVDQAGIVPADIRASLETRLSELETKSGIQLVVATVATLGGSDIETYANRLFRTWKLGEQARNNGVLLLVAPNDRRVRIEVGYGLEGTLTDALSKVIITNAITPRFRTNDFGGGIERGVEDIVTVLTTDSDEWEKRPDLRLDASTDVDYISPVISTLIMLFIILLIASPRFRKAVLPAAGKPGIGGSSGRDSVWGSGSSWSGRSGGSSWSSGSSGGFSGGGGSSGGGGASGSW